MGIIKIIWLINNEKMNNIDTKKPLAFVQKTSGFFIISYGN